MSEVDIWRGWSTRLKEIATELGKLSEEKTGSTTKERRYKEYLKLALQHMHIAEEAATAVSEDIEHVGLQPRPQGPSPSSRLAMTVRFASDMLGWPARKIAADATITTAQYMLIRNGTGTPQPEAVEKLFAALARQGIDMIQLTHIVDTVLDRRTQQPRTAHGNLEPEALSGEATSTQETTSSAVSSVPPAGAKKPVETIYQPSSTGDGDERPPPQWQ